MSQQVVIPPARLFLLIVVIDYLPNRKSWLFGDRSDKRRALLNMEPLRSFLATFSPDKINLNEKLVNMFIEDRFS